VESVAYNFHAIEDDSSSRAAGGDFDRQKPDERPRIGRDVLIADSAIMLRRAHEHAGTPACSSATIAGVSKQVASRWTTAPLDHPPPLYIVLAHPAVAVEAAALLLKRAAEQLATEPLDVSNGLVRVLAATAEIEAVLARRGAR